MLICQLDFSCRIYPFHECRGRCWFQPYDVGLRKQLSRDHVRSIGNWPSCSIPFPSWLRDLGERLEHFDMFWRPRVCFLHMLILWVGFVAAVPIMACSHRRRGWDKTVLSRLQLCLHHQQDNFVLSPPSFQFQFCLIWTQFRWVLSRLDPVSNLQLIACALVFTPQTRTRQGSFVLSVLAVWTQLEDTTKLSCLVCVGGVNTTVDKTRQFCYVSNCVHTADTDKTKLSCFVCVGGLNKP